VSIEASGRLPALPHMLRRGALPMLHGKEACERLVLVAESMGLAPVASTAWLARLASVPQIDPGEAQLFASAAEHELIVVTGDKRSVIASIGSPGATESARGHRSLGFRHSVMVLSSTRAESRVLIGGQGPSRLRFDTRPAISGYASRA